MKKLMTLALLAFTVLAGCKKDEPEPAPTPLKITTHPANQEVTVGGVPATFSVAARGGKTPYTYLWERFDGGSWNGINDNTALWSGRTTPTLTVNARIMFNGYQFRCIVKDANNARVISNAATLTVTVDPKSDFYGTWKYEVDGRWYRVTIAADKIVYLDIDGYGYTLENLTWEPVTSTNSVYPTGHKVTGTLTAVSYYQLYKPDLSGYAAVGGTAVAYWYIGTDKEELMWWYGLTVIPEPEPDYGPFVKQPWRGRAGECIDARPCVYTLERRKCLNRDFNMIRMIYVIFHARRH